jgi:2-polyprenyl-3-methyl-5-hydroxy-6-metoxy-1,4-benzoquinol methylase
MSAQPIVTERPMVGEKPVAQRRVLAARLEPFDSYWQAPADIESGYSSFAAYYRANYLSYLPADKSARILVVSCGPGYLVNVLAEAGYKSVMGIDSDPAKVEHARRRNLPCEAAEAFPYLEGSRGQFDVIIPEQELNHLTHEETIEFLSLCHAALRPGGRIIVYAMNGANPFVGAENLAHNIDHFYIVTEYSLGQLLQLGGFRDIKPFALKLYVFWKNPLNYVGLAVTSVLEFGMRVLFRMYGKKVSVLSKKVAAVAFRA